MWEIFSPLILRSVIAYVVQFIIIGIYTFQHMAEYVTGDTVSQEQITEMSMEITMEMYQYITEITALTALATIPFIFWLMRKDRQKEQLAGIVENKKAPFGKYVLIVGMSIPFALGVNNILLLSNLAEYSAAYQETAEILYTPSLPVQLVCLGVIVPILEEMLFRGVIYRRMRINTTVMRAILNSALLFGLYHGNMVQFLYGFVCGLLLAYLYEKYGSIWAPIMAHMCMNIVSCLLTEADVFTWMFSQKIRLAVITIGCAALASTMFVLIRQIEEKLHEPQDVVVED